MPSFVRKPSFASCDSVVLTIRGSVIGLATGFLNSSRNSHTSKEVLSSIACSIICFVRLYCSFSFLVTSWNFSTVSCFLYLAGTDLRGLPSFRHINELFPLSSTDIISSISSTGCQSKYSADCSVSFPSIRSVRRVTSVKPALTLKLRSAISTARPSLARRCAPNCRLSFLYFWMNW